MSLPILNKFSSSFSSSSSISYFWLRPRPARRAGACRPVSLTPCLSKVVPRPNFRRTVFHGFLPHLPSAICHLLSASAFCSLSPSSASCPAARRVPHPLNQLPLNRSTSVRSNSPTASPPVRIWETAPPVFSPPSHWTAKASNSSPTSKSPVKRLPPRAYARQNRRSPRPLFRHRRRPIDPPNQTVILSSPATK